MPKVKAKSMGEHPVNQWRNKGDVFDYTLGKGEKLPAWVEAQGGSSTKAAPKSKSQPEDTKAAPKSKSQPEDEADD